MGEWRRPGNNLAIDWKNISNTIFRGPLIFRILPLFSLFFLILQTNSIICVHNLRTMSKGVEQKIYMQNTHKIVCSFLSLPCRPSLSLILVDYL